RYLTNKNNSQLSIQLDNLVLNSDKKLDLRIIENKFVTPEENNHCVYLSAEQEQDLKALGLFDKNLYCAPFDNLVLAKFYSHQEICDAIQDFSLTAWQQCSQNDGTSEFKTIKGNQNQYANLNLIGNCSMTNNTEGWIAWPS